MARKQNKSVKTPKKASSVSINIKKGGKVQKKQTDNKTKKKVETQIKQTIKSQGKKNTSQVKQISPENAGRRSSRRNSDNSKKSSTPASKRIITAKVSIPTKPATPPKTVKAQAASKRKSNPVEQAESKKRASTSSSQKSNKKETAPADNKKAANNMSLRGKKRSYAQLASGNKTEDINVSKKRKAVNTKDMTSRGNRSIKPTVKGSEWRNTILQKKSGGTKQEQARKTPLKNKPSNISNKSPIQNKKTSPPKMVGGTQSGSKADNKKSPKSKRQSGGKVLALKKQKQSPKSIVKNTAKTDTVSIKSTRARGKSITKPDDNEKDSSKTSNLATSIKNKFNSCVSNKRKSRGAHLQENVLVAQGILHDILDSVGTQDTIPTDEKSEDLGDVKLATSNLETLPVKEQDQGEVYESKLDIISDPSQTINIPESGSNSVVIEEEKPLSVSGNFENESTLETNCNKLTESNIDSDKKVEVEIENAVIDADKEILDSKEHTVTQNKNNEDELQEEMELHLSDTSVTSLNDNEVVSSASKSTVSKTNGNINNSVLSNKPDDWVDSNLVSEIKLKEKPTEQENELAVQLQNEKTSCVNGDDSPSGFVAASSQENEKKASPPKISPDVSGVVLDSSSSLTNSISTHEKSVEVKEDTAMKDTLPQEERLENSACYKQESIKDGKTVIEIGQNSQNEAEVIANTNKEGIEPVIQINHCKSESSSGSNSKNTNNIAEEHVKVKEIPKHNLNSETVNGEHCIVNEIKSDIKSNFSRHQDVFNCGNNTILDKKEINTSLVNDNSSLTNSHSSSLDKTQNKLMGITNIEQSKVINDKCSLSMSNGGESIPFDASSQGSNGMTVGSSFKTQEIPCPGKKSSSSHENKETEPNDIIVGNVSTNLLTSNESFKNDAVKLKANSSLHSTANLKSEINLDKHSLEDREKVGTEEAKLQIETSQISECLKMNNLKSQGLKVDELRLSEELPIAFDISSNNVEESNKIASGGQKVDNDCTTGPEKVDPLNSVSKNSPLQKVGLEKNTLASQVTSSHHGDSSDCNKITCEDISPVDGNFENTSSATPDLQLGHDAKEIIKEIALNVSSETVEREPVTGQLESIEESTGLTEDINKVTYGNTSSSSHVDQQMPMDEPLLHGDIEANKKTNDSTNFTADANKITLGNCSGSSYTKQISVNDTNSSTTSQNDVNLSLKTSLENLETLCPSKEIGSSNAEIPANDIEKREISKDFSTMEGGNQEELVRDSIIIDDTDGESMQCNSETQSSNRMSVDEDNSGMEVDSEEMAAVANACSTSEMNMEVS